MRVMSPVVKSTPLGFERFYLPLFLRQRERETRSSLNAGSLLTHTFGTATLRVGVLAVGMRIRVMHGIAGSTGVSKFFLVLNHGVKFLNYVTKSVVNFPLMTCSLYWFFQFPIAFF